MPACAELFQRIWPPVPEAVRDAFALSVYERFARQVMVLYAALLVILVAAGAVTGEASHPLISYGLPGVVGTACVVRLATWLRRPPRVTCPDKARRALDRSRILSCIVCGICSLWCMLLWLDMPKEQAPFVLLFLSMGSLATVSSVSVSRSCALACTASGLLPVALLLFFADDGMPIAAGLSILTAGCFAMQLSLLQHGNLVKLLVLQHSMRMLSETDPLTGLPNRRALYERLETGIAAARSGTGPTLIVLDLDNFKPVNDRHGHAMGDDLLREVAQRLRSAAGDDGEVCRLGGDEFAILIRPGASREDEAIAVALLSSLIRPIIIGREQFHIGACLGMSSWPDDGTTTEDLIASADTALYAAKGERDDEDPDWDQAVLKA